MSMILPGSLILAISFAVGIYMAWNIGANDVANAMAASVGSKAITLRQAVIIASTLDFIGAALIGSHVAQTIRKNIVDASLITDPNIMVLGLLAALAAASLWVFFATWKHFPISTTHSIVGAMIGFGLIAGGPSVINWGKTLLVVVSWILSPFFASIISFSMFQIIRRHILMKKETFQRALRMSPIFAGAALFVIFLSLLLKTPLGKKIGFAPWEGIAISAILAAILSVVGYHYFRIFIKKREEEGVEEVFRRLQVITACYVALAHGANDVANAMGPLAGIYIILITGSIAPETPVPTFLLSLGGAAIALGVITWGYRVIETVGSKITTLTNSRGFCVDFGTATSVLVASKLGFPVSTTHAAVGAVIGVGLARGIEAVDFSVVGKIMIYWIVTLPIAAISCMIIFKFFTFLFL
ncbi:MAG: inorganic phosphate transporter [Desulfatiglandales bacterium]